MTTANDPPVATPSDAAAPESAPASGCSTPPLSKNQEKNEAKRRAKMEKFLAKQAKQASQASQPAQPEGAGKKKKNKDGLLKEKDRVFVNKTPAGEKKDVSEAPASTYNPRAVESAWYAWWEQKGFFKPRLDASGNALEAGTFVIPIPPPNVTGTLHLGHALGNSIQDCLIRWNRMRGLSTLWIPGCDHAGIATQVVVEKQLMRTQKKSRHDLGREAFIEQVFKWKDEKQASIYDQLRRLGASYDWDYARFTMDPELSTAVTEAFCRLYEDGTIYRATRLVNWDTKLKTALSNLEVDSRELEGRTLLTVPDHDPERKYEFGVLISFAYPIEGSPDERVVVATTRIETMLGDTAIAVHPDDKRYTHLHGRHVVHPFQPERRIPIVLDAMVDPEFGTGCVKITPAHDFNDYEVGKRHNLPFINILNDDGTLNDNAAPFAGMKRFDARVAVIKALQAKGLYVEKKDNRMVLPICSRSGNIVEPLIKAQWWVSCEQLAAPAREAVRSGALRISPRSSERDWFRWLDNVQDWCISRQLWWGHQVPAYFVNIRGRANQEHSDGANYVCGRTEAEALANARSKFPDVAPEDMTLERDPDVLDTWFSSGLWPFSVLGWPQKTRGLELYYPNTLLETGWDILFFWVARMVMLGLKLTGKLPFTEVYTHAVLRDAHGRKMSKSLGNVIDPVHVIEGRTLKELHETLLAGNLDPKEVARATEGQKRDFPRGILECGTDALRFALCSYAGAGREVNLDVSRVEGYRKFCNKLWNAVRFGLLKLGDAYRPPAEHTLRGDESAAARWILHRMNVTAREVNAALPAYNFVQATASIYAFLLQDLCDVFIEVVKPVIDSEGSTDREREIARDALYTALEGGLRLMHPFMPYLTEELWQRLPRRPDGADLETIMLAPYPVPVAAWEAPELDADYERVKQVVFATRSLITDNSLDKGSVAVHVAVADEAAAESVRACERDILALTRGFASLKVGPCGKISPPEDSLSREAPGNVTVYVSGGRPAST